MARFQKCAKDSASVKPAGSILAKNLVPIDFAGFQLGDGGLAAIGTAEGRAQAEASFGKIQSIANGAADSVKRNPAHIFLTDASLEHQVFDETSDRIVSEGSDDRRVHAKASPEAAGYVVFASTLPYAKMTRRGDALVPWIEAQHDFAKAD